MNTKSPL